MPISSDNIDHGGVGLVTAELVADPVHAIEVTVHHDNYQSDLESPRPPEQQQDRVETESNPSTAVPRSVLSEQSPYESVTANKESFNKLRRLGLIILIALLCLIVVAIAVPVSIVSGSKNDKTSSSQEDVDVDIESVDVAVTPAPTVSYACFQSTHELNKAQQEFQEQSMFILCPNTWIQIGELDTTAPEGTRFKNGDSAIVIIRENVEVRCGLDGSVHNNCTLEAGHFHMVIQKDLSKNAAGLVARRDKIMSPFVVLPFTGTIGRSIFTSFQSVILSNPGEEHTVGRLSLGKCDCT